MHIRDFLNFTMTAIKAHRLRSWLTILCIAIGICAVVFLTSIGEGIHRFVLAEFTQFGTTLIGINPGKATTFGASVGVFGSEKPITIDDAEALRRIPSIEAVVPLVQGNAEVEAGKLRRRTTVYGSGADFPTVFKINVASGNFLPADDPHSPRAYAVLGSKLKAELFQDNNPLGQRIRISGERYRIIGTMESKGQILGFDLDDTVYIPTERALSLFNRDGLMEIDVIYKPQANEEMVVEDIRKMFIARHGKDDVTITTQQQMMDVLGSILDILTFAVGALGGISLVVGGVGILTISTMAVKERTSEIGLLRAIGARRVHILWLFLGEATLLATLGGIGGLGVGVLGAQTIHMLLPALPIHISVLYVIISVMLSVVIGLISGVIPAMQAARLNPVIALRAE